MGISDMMITSPMYCLSTSDYNEANSWEREDNKGSEEDRINREKREKECFEERKKKSKSVIF